MFRKIPGPTIQILYRVLQFIFRQTQHLSRTGNNLSRTPSVPTILCQIIALVRLAFGKNELATADPGLESTGPGFQDEGLGNDFLAREPRRPVDTRDPKDVSYSRTRGNRGSRNTAEPCCRVLDPGDPVDREGRGSGPASVQRADSPGTGTSRIIAEYRHFSLYSRFILLLGTARPMILEVYTSGWPGNRTSYSTSLRTGQ